jgi:HAD superfamily hydrolase (TIGR01509 family)
MYSRGQALKYNSLMTPLSPVRIDAVLLDLFDTLVSVDASRLPELVVGDRAVHSTVPAVLRELRLALPGLADADALHAMAAVLKERPRVSGNAEIPEHALFAAFLARLGVSDDGDALARRLADAQMAAVVAACRPVPGAEALLATLRARRVRSALVSNIAHLESVCALAAIPAPEHRFDAIVTSIEVGYCKPDARPFEVALERAGVEAEDAIHIGDDASDDVAGAAAAGIHPVWFNPSGRAWPGPAGSAPTTITTLAGAEALLRASGR